MSIEVTLAERIAELVEQHGTLRAAARVIDIDIGYLSRLANGEKVRPSKKFLNRMGLRAVLAYERHPNTSLPLGAKGQIETESDSAAIREGS